MKWSRVLPRQLPEASGRAQIVRARIPSKGIYTKVRQWNGSAGERGRACKARTPLAETDLNRPRTKKAQQRVLQEVTNPGSPYSVVQ